MEEKIAILGGTFDPIHLGHIKMAEAVLNSIDIDKVYFMPSKNPPHKMNKIITEEKHRCNMVKLSIEDNERFTFSDFDLVREGPSYTAITLTKLKEQNPNLSIYFIIGGDSLRDIEKWYMPEVVMSNCTLLTCIRDEIDETKMNEIIISLKDKYSCNIIPIKMERIDISSTQIRKNLVTDREYGKYENILNKKVFNYIIKNKLYTFNDTRIGTLPKDTN